jgi:hypothetical protein
MPFAKPAAADQQPVSKENRVFYEFLGPKISTNSQKNVTIRPELRYNQCFERIQQCKYIPYY